MGLGLSLGLCAQVPMDSIRQAQADSVAQAMLEQLDEEDEVAMSYKIKDVTKTAQKKGIVLDRKGLLQTENVSQQGLQKMACCTVAESFENSASVTVGFADAISGARQIKMLGLSGTYTQLLDESRPIMQGIGAPYALNYTPGDWLAGISISKGVTSVASGHEAITGQINMEYRKPFDRERLHINAYLDDQLRPELNLTSALTLDKEERLQTIILLHGSGDTDVRHMDMNHDGFRDQPETWAVNAANKWLYRARNGQMIRWGWKYTHENRQGGMLDGKRQVLPTEWQDSLPYSSQIRNDAANAYVKWAIPLGAKTLDAAGNEQQPNLAFVADYDFFKQDSYYGLNTYEGQEHVASVKAMYNHYFGQQHTLMVGLNWKTDWTREGLENLTPWNNRIERMTYNAEMAETELGAYAEYTYTLPDKLTLQAGLRADYNSLTARAYATPRLHLKWNITPSTTLRASAGTGYRMVRPVTDNIGMLATGRTLQLPEYRKAEEAWNAGISLVQQCNLGRLGVLTLSVDYYRTQFWQALILDQEMEADAIHGYYSSGRNFTDTWQLDATWTPLERFDIYLTFRYNNSRYTLTRPDGGTEFVERPLMGRFKGLLNIRYATKFNKWIFDATAQLNGKSRLPSQTGNLQDATYSPVFPMFYAQVTRKIKTVDLYLGCENIGNYTQKTPVLSAENPWSTEFNSMNVWGPLMGRKFYLGMRWNLF